MTYEEIVARAIHKRALLQEHLDHVLTPFEQEPAICWICTRDMWGYICAEAYGEITVAERPDIWMDTREIRYRGLSVHIRNGEDAQSDEDKLFPAIVLTSVEQGLIDRLVPGIRILRGDSILEVLEWSIGSNALTLFGLILSGYAEDRAFSAGVYAGRIGTTETHQWNYRQTGISDEPVRVNYDFDRAWERERARDLYLRFTDPVFSQGTSSMEFRYGDSRMKRDILAGEWLGDLRTTELDDNFESADLSILFGTAPNE